MEIFPIEPEKKEEEDEKNEDILKTIIKENNKEKKDALYMSQIKQVKNQIKRDENENVFMSQKREAKKEENENNLFIEENYTKYEDSLFNKVNLDYMHNRFINKFNYIKGLRNMLQAYHDICKEFSKKISSISGKFIFQNMVKKQKPLKSEQEKENQTNNKKGEQLVKEEEEFLSDSINKTCGKIFSLIKKQSNIFLQLANDLNSILSNSNSSLSLPKDFKYFYPEKKEKELYYSSKNLLNEYNRYKPSYMKVKKEYESNFKYLEELYRDIEEKKDPNKNNKINNTILKLKNNNYENCTKEINKKKNEKIKKQKVLLNLYQYVDIDISRRIKEIIGKLIEFFNQSNKKNNEILEELENQYKLIDIKKDIDYYIQKCIEENKKEVFVDEIFEYKAYKPFSIISVNTISSSEKEINESKVNYNIISSLKTNFNDLDVDLNEENHKKELITIMQSMFYPKENFQFSQKEKGRLLNLLRIKKIRKLFIIILSNQRTKGRYQQSWQLINDLGDILRFILNLSQKENNYENAKDCLIISQTFYSERKDSKKKHYLFDTIKHHKWLKSIEFWEGITENMVTKEIENNNEVLGKEALENESEIQRVDRISQVYMSQLFTFSQNMIDLGIEKKDIERIVEKSCEKFGVIDSIKNAIYENLNSLLPSLPINPEVEGIDEISLYIKKRQRTIVNPRKIICINNIIFNDNGNKIKINKKIDEEIKRMNSSILLPSILKLKRNKTFDNIKKEIKINIDLRSNRKLKSEIINKENNFIKDLKGKRSKSSKIEKDKIEEKNEIILQEKDEKNNNNEEDKKEELYKQEEKKEEDINKNVEDINKKEEDKKEEPKKEEDINKNVEDINKKEEDKKEEIQNEVEIKKEEPEKEQEIKIEK